MVYLPVREIIHSLKLVDYLLVQVENHGITVTNNYSITSANSYSPCNNVVRLIRMQNIIVHNFCLANKNKISLDGWVTCDFMSCLTVFQSYQDDGRMMIKGCAQWNPVYV